MRNPLLHVLFLAVPLLVAELGVDRPVRSLRLAALTSASTAAVPNSPSRTDPKPAPAPATRATPPVQPAARRPLPAHLFM